MLPVTWGSVCVFLHVTAATIWLGGQLAIAGLVPGLRVGPSAPFVSQSRSPTSGC